MSTKHYDGMTVAHLIALLKMADQDKRIVLLVPPEHEAPKGGMYGIAEVHQQTDFGDDVVIVANVY